VNSPFAALFLVLVCAWTGALLVGVVALDLPKRRILALSLDLFGTWMGALAALALLVGRKGFTAAWAGALGCVALMVTASLYDRAVLMPSLEAALRRLEAGEERERWERDRSFLARMAVAGRWVTLGLGIAALLLGAFLA